MKQEHKIIRIDTGLQLVDLPVSRIQEIMTDKKSFMYFEKNKDDSFTMTYSKDMFKTLN